MVNELMSYVIAAITIDKTGQHVIGFVKKENDKWDITWDPRFAYLFPHITEAEYCIKTNFLNKDTIIQMDKNEYEFCIMNVKSKYKIVKEYKNDN